MEKHEIQNGVIIQGSVSDEEGKKVFMDEGVVTTEELASIGEDKGIMIFRISKENGGYLVNGMVRASRPMIDAVKKSLEQVNERKPESPDITEMETRLKGMLMMGKALQEVRPDNEELKAKVNELKIMAELIDLIKEMEGGK